jgi:hypothetical protein
MTEQWQAINVMGVWMVGNDTEKRLLFKIPAGSIDAEQIAKLAAAAPDLLAALQGILAEPYGCTLCDSGTPRNPVKGHQPDCPYEIARAALAKARGAT